MRWLKDWLWARRLGRIMRPLMRNTPRDKIKRGESCSWSLNPQDVALLKRAVERYAKAHKEKP